MNESRFCVFVDTDQEKKTFHTIKKSIHILQNATVISVFSRYSWFSFSGHPFHLAAGCRCVAFLSSLSSQQVLYTLYRDRECLSALSGHLPEVKGQPPLGFIQQGGSVRGIKDEASWRATKPLLSGRAQFLHIWQQGPSKRRSTVPKGLVRLTAIVSIVTVLFIGCWWSDLCRKCDDVSLAACSEVHMWQSWTHNDCCLFVCWGGQSQKRTDRGRVSEKIKSITHHTKLTHTTVESDHEQLSNCATSMLS